MSGEINWGEPIEVDGKRPEWLAADQAMQYRHRIEHHGWGKSLARHRSWDDADWQCVVAIRLPADHPHYAAQNAPTAPPGGEVGPEAIERMKNLVRLVSDGALRHDMIEEEARAIRVLIEPVDTDRAEAKRIAEAVAEGAGIFGLSDLEQAAQAGIRSGRLAEGEDIAAIAPRRHPTTDSRNGRGE